MFLSGFWGLSRSDFDDSKGFSHFPRISGVWGPTEARTRSLNFLAPARSFRLTLVRSLGTFEVQHHTQT